MDLSVLLAGLTAADKAAQQSNPYAPFDSAAQGIGSVLLKGAQNYSVGDNLVAGLLTGIAGGYSQHLGDEYVKQQDSLARSLLQEAMHGTANGGIQPEDMAPQVFSAVKQTGDLFNVTRQMELEDEKRQAALRAQTAIDQARQLAPIDVATDIAKRTAELKLTQSMYPGLAGVPAALQDDVLKQRQQAQQANKIDSTIDKYFEQARNINTLSTLNPLSTASNDMTGIQVGLTNMLQAAQGREMNESARKALQATLPDWNDTQAQIDAKKMQFKEMFHSILPETPLANGIGSFTGAAAPAQGAAQYTADQAAQAGYSAAEIESLKQQGFIK